MGLEGANPLANALMPGGALTPGQQRGAGVSKDDMQFLQQHVKATEVTHTFARRAGLEGRGLAGVSSVIEGKLPTGTGKAGSALEARYDHTFSQTKRIELPTATRGYRVWWTSTPLRNRFGARHVMWCKWARTRGRNPNRNCGSSV